MAALTETDLLTYTRTIKSDVSKTTNKNNVWVDFANILPMLISGAISSSEANQENSKQEQAANNLKKSEETVRNTTNSKVEEFKQQIQTEIEKINEKLEEIQYKEEEKAQIEEQIKEQTEEIEKASAYLNGESQNGYASRREAIEAIINAHTNIKGLNSKISEIAALYNSAQRDISNSQSAIGSTVSQMNTTVQDGNTQLQQLSNEGTQQQNQNNQLNSQGKASETKGQQEVATGEATQNYTLIQQGQDHQTAGQTLQTGSQQNNAKVISAQGLIKVDLTQLTADATSIGSIANQGLTLAEQVQSVWGVIGEWATGVNQELTTELDAIEEAAKKADAIIKEEEQNQNSTDEESNGNTNENSNQSESKTFEYDVTNLKKFAMGV